MAEPQAHRDPLAMQQFFADYGITTTHFVPSMLAAFMASFTAESVSRCCSLRQVFCSGEALAAVTGASVPIGFPVWNSGLRILDTMMRPVPFGVAGDLYLTGVQLAQGYLGREDLTANSFIADPFAPGERMYRTGDIARWLENGAVEYLGRSDNQLKIRGQRIELGDIEQAMLVLPDVEQAVAVACVINQAAATHGDARQLVGYVVSTSGLPLDTDDLLTQLREHLPLPTLTTQKKGRVPEPGVETQVANAFSQLLGCDINDIDADFFALGGHSLLAMRLAAILSESTGRQITPGQVMVSSTVGKLSELLTSDDGVKTQRLGYETWLPLRRGEGPTLYCFHPASGFAWQFSVLSRYLSPRWSITGIQSPRPDGPLQSAETLDAVCEYHLATLLAQQPHGPYYLLGYSLGGTLAQGIAARLQQRGEKVAFLGLLDTWPPEIQNWSAKEANGLEPAVLTEISRERDAFIAAQQGQSSHELFNMIEGNYADAVRLLATAHSAVFEGKTTLFVAEKTR